ncbi:MAG: DUF1553 domain-containing protein [Planctomycetia bacterium]|nr:DUF1553 domain-containing protein [Planctomycetia bacterium]
MSHSGQRGVGKSGVAGTLWRRVAAGGRLPTRFGEVVCGLLVGLAGAQAAAEPDFERDIRPILAEHCAHCHGGDAGTRAAGLRLDRREAALAGGDSGTPAIVPGQPETSALVARITSTDPDVVMPPPAAKKPLTAAQVAALEAWIGAGAAYADHWAFIPPRQQPLPGDDPGAHPIDAFVADKLAAEGVTFSPPADPATLSRRIHLDVTGLPPTPEAVAAAATTDPDALVDSLLASERYGEKWGRHWLDLARYADTNGYEKDMPREMWAWRDWVIAALNRDLPYDRFVIEQLAGDLLPAATQDQVVATGFLRNSMLNEEGAIIAEEFRMVELFDRMDCLGKAVVGLTIQCAQCHAHKFDPLSQDDYYGIFAFLNDTSEARSWVHTPDQLATLADLRARVAALGDEVRAARPGWRDELAAWEREVAAGLPPWTPILMADMSSSGLLTHPAQLEDAAILMIGHRDGEMIFEAEPALAGATGLQLEALPHGDLFLGGPGRDGTWGLAELTAAVRRPGSETWEPLKLVAPSADFSNPERIDVRPAAADGKQPERRIPQGPVAALVDGDPDSVWESDRGELLRHQPSVAVVRFERPLDHPAGTRLKLTLRMPPGGAPRQQSRMLGCCRFSLTTATDPAAPPIDHAAILAIRTDPARRTAGDEAALFSAWMKTVPELAPQVAAIAAQWARAAPGPTSVMHLAARPPGRGRRTHLLERGEWNKPLAEVTAHVPGALHPFPTDTPADRLGFARWLVDRRSPLAARVVVNRIWQQIFGVGLVETPDDFGTRAAVPLHRDLLDWLAVDFMEHGWSQKRLIAQILRSRTYRQSSQATAEILARDPGNRLLARGPRFRVDAEVVRDIALSAAGLLTHAGGGPGVHPPVPQNVLDYNFVRIDWPTATGPDRYRRSIYTFRRRSMPDPLLGTFDSPNGDVACARRLRSNTPLAALAGLNEPVFVEAARALALRVLREGGGDDRSRIDHGFLLCTGRLPHDAERAALLTFLEGQRRRLADGWLNPREVATGAVDALPALPAGTSPQDAAAWTLAARVLLNLDETVTKN